MVLAIVAGVASGVLGFLPLIACIQLAKRATDTSNFGHAGSMLLGVLVSFLVLAGTMIACAFLFRDLLLPFALAEVAALIVAAVAYGVYKLVRK